MLRTVLYAILGLLTHSPMAENNKIPAPHDTFFKKAFGNPQVGRDLIKAHLPKDIVANIDLRALRLTNKSFVTSALQSRHSDLVFKTKVKRKPGYIYLLIEHQSTQDQHMPLRLLEYNVQLMRQHLEDEKTDKLPLILNVLMANTGAPYRGPYNLMEAFEQPELAKELMFRAYHLLSWFSQGFVVPQSD